MGSSLQLQHLERNPALHVATAVRPSGVVAVHEVLRDVVDVGQPVEPAAVKRRSVALLEHGSVEPLDDRVVVRRAGRDPVMIDPERLTGRSEGVADELGPVEFLTGVKPSRPP
jgi:mRNA degradation ribonuclease J1/J2